MLQAISYLRFLSRRFVQDRCFMVAGSLTFTTLLALVPLFTVTITLTSKIGLTREFVQQVKVFMIKNLVPDVAGKVVGVYMEQFAQNAARLTYVGLIFIVISAVALMFTIDAEFNAIWRAKRKRSMLKRSFAYLAVLTLGPLLVGVGLTMTRSVIDWMRRFESQLPSLDDWLLLAVPVTLTTLALLLAYRVIPRRHVPVRHALAGALLAAALFEIMKLLFVGYVTRVGDYSVVYGAFSSIPIFLLWLFCCWLVVLAGAEVAATLSYLRHPEVHDTIQLQDVTARALSVLQEHAQPMKQEAIRHQLRLPIDVTEDALDVLRADGLIDAISTRDGVFYTVPPAEQDAQDG